MSMGSTEIPDRWSSDQRADCHVLPCPRCQEVDKAMFKIQAKSAVLLVVRYVAGRDCLSFDLFSVNPLQPDSGGGKVYKKSVRALRIESRPASPHTHGLQAVPLQQFSAVSSQASRLRANECTAIRCAVVRPCFRSWIDCASGWTLRRIALRPLLPATIDKPNTKRRKGPCSINADPCR